MGASPAPAGRRPGPAAGFFLDRQLTSSEREHLRDFAVSGAAVVLGFDGTLVPRVQRSGRVRMRRSTQDLLTRLAARRPVAVVSSREDADLRERLPVPRLLVVGAGSPLRKARKGALPGGALMRRLKCTRIVAIGTEAAALFGHAPDPSLVLALPLSNGSDEPGSSGSAPRNVDGVLRLLLEWSEPAGAPRSPDSARALEVLRLLWAVDHGMRTISRQMQDELGVTAQERLVVRFVGEHPGIAAGELARALRRHPSTLTPLVSRLVSRGLLAARTDERDARRLLLDLKPAAQQARDAQAGTLEAAVVTTLARLPLATVDTARSFLSTLADAVDEVVARGRGATGAADLADGPSDES